VNDAEFSHDDNFIVTAGGDNTVRVWEKDNGAPVTIFNTRDVPVSVAFSPDNKYVVTGGFLGLVSVLPCDACRPFEAIKRSAINSTPRLLTKPERQQFELITEEESTEKDK
jgi:WD40 repeat protein